ncbi:MAG: MEDS domain-containing protein [Acidimicrobiia bacterium]
MPSTRAIDINGLQASPGDHICVFYRGEAERRRIMLPFLADGLRAGDKCICIVSPSDHRCIESEVLDSGPGEPGSLRLEHFSDTYTRGGSFDSGHMMDFWRQWGAETFEVEPRPSGRTVSDMSWAQDLFSTPALDDFMAYEAEATRFSRAYSAVALCLYDIDRFGGNVIIPALRVHPKMLFAGMLLENPYFVDPDEG